MSARDKAERRWPKSQWDEIRITQSAGEIRAARRADWVSGAEWQHGQDQEQIAALQTVIAEVRAWRNQPLELADMPAHLDLDAILSAAPSDVLAAHDRRKRDEVVSHLADAFRDGGLDEGETFEEWLRGYIDYMHAEFDPEEENNA